MNRSLLLPHCLLAIFAAWSVSTRAEPLLAQGSLAGPRLFPRGAQRAGAEDTRYDKATNSYLFTLRDIAGKIIREYRLPLSHAYMKRGVLRIEETTTGIVPMEAGGLLYRSTPAPSANLGRVILPYDLAFSRQHDPRHTGSIISHSLNPLTRSVTLRIRDEYLVNSKPLRTEKTYTLRLMGTTLEIHAAADARLRTLAQYNYAGFYFGRGTGLATPARALHIPYMDGIPVFMGNNGVSVSRFIDWYMSSGTATPAPKPAVTGQSFVGETGSAVFRNDKNEWNAPVDEYAYITISNRIADHFPVIDRPPSEYRLLTADRAVSQNGPKSRFDVSKNWVDRAVTMGMNDMLHIKWDWHKWPFNLNDPDFLPPSPAMPVGTIWGTNKEWIGFVDAQTKANWSLILYYTVNMMDPGYPNLTLKIPRSRVGSVLLTANPAYDARQCVRDAAMNIKKGWDTNQNLANTNLRGKGHKVDVFGQHLTEGRLRSYASRFDARGGFRVGGLHLDAQTSIPHTFELDQRKGNQFAHTIAEGLRNRENSFRAGKDVMQGPLLSENSHWRYKSFETYFAGLIDGSSRKIPISWSPPESPRLTNWDAAVIPDFELSEVISKSTAFFGMGWHPHFKTSKFPVPAPWIDAWNTTLLSYGHSPFFSTNGDVRNNYWDWQGTTGNYHLCAGLSAAMRSSKITQVRYLDASQKERTLDEALALGLDMKHPRLVLRFANGLEFKANHSASNWSTKVLNKSYTIPMDGFVGADPRGLLALSAINPTGGKRVDYAKVPGVSEMIDRRGYNQSYAGFPGSLLPIPIGLFTPPISDLDLCIVKDLRTNRVLYAQNFKTAQKALGLPPTLRSLSVLGDDTDTMSVGRLRLGYRAIATDSNGNKRDVTGLVTWTSSNAGVALVNRSGGLVAKGVGSCLIQANLASPRLSASKAVKVTVLPILGKIEFAAISSATAFASFTSDSRALIAGALYRQLPSGPYRLVISRQDPAAKHHRVVLDGLASNGQYEVIHAAVSEYGFVTVSKPLRFKTP